MEAKLACCTTFLKVSLVHRSLDWLGKATEGSGVRKSNQFKVGLGHLGSLNISPYSCITTASEEEESANLASGLGLSLSKSITSKGLCLNGKV